MPVFRGVIRLAGATDVCPGLGTSGAIESLGEQGHSLLSF